VHLRACREKLAGDRAKFDDEYHVRVSEAQTSVTQKKDVIGRENDAWVGGINTEIHAYTERTNQQIDRLRADQHNHMISIEGGYTQEITLLEQERLELARSLEAQRQALAQQRLAFEEEKRTTMSQFDLHISELRSRYTTIEYSNPLNAKLE
jgi:hypothetical protein